jgi:monovalent cation/hydrogen antiporter
VRGIETILVLVVLGTVVAAFAGRLRVPAPSLLVIAGQFAVLAAGGAATGAVIAAGVIRLRRRVTDPVLETVIALITPYAAYVLGEALHVSPVMTVIVTGLAAARRAVPGV